MSVFVDQTFELLGDMKVVQYTLDRLLLQRRKH